MACKHYYALFGSKWSYSTQKNQNSFFNGQVIVRPLEQKIWRIIYVREVHIKARKNIYPDICRIADRYIDKVENVICN